MTFVFDVPEQVKTATTKQMEEKVADEISIIKSELGKRYDTLYASFALCHDPYLLDEVLRLASKYKSYDTVVVVGIGGSNLGTAAICDAILGRDYNSTSDVRKGRAPALYFSDTVDSYSMSRLLEILEEEIKAKKKILVNVISKSGTTTETVANFEAIYGLLTSHRLPIEKHVVITTDKGSALWKFAERKNIPALAIPRYVGGRYSVFSSVGLFPLAVLNIDIKRLRKGALDMQKACMRSLKNPAMISAVQYAHYAQHGVNVFENFVFDGRLESLGKWYRQLMGESLGKQYDVSGREVWNGLTPTVAVGSTDLHSMAQLYLGGPRDKYITFIVPSAVPTVKLQKDKDFDELVGHLQKKRLEEIMSSIVEGISGALAKQSRPYSLIKLDPKNVEDLGAFMQMKMFEIVFLARIMSVNPFDQPNVEEYKLITKSKLARR